MTSGHVFIASSLDGFIARPDGALDWLLSRDTGAEDHGYQDFIAGMDAIVMGRATFETVRAMDPWPYSVPVVVLSRRMTPDAIPAALAGRVAVTAGTPAQVMADCAARGWRRVYVDGGQVVQAFLRAGLIADMVITWVPVLLGQGRALFGPLSGDVALTHLGTRAFASGLVQSHYRVAA